MKLTDKCKEDFEKWYNDYFMSIKKSGQSTSMSNKGQMNISRFEWLKQSMQYGVYVDFFDSVGLELVVHKSKTKYVASIYYVIKPHLYEDEEVKCNKKGYSNRQKAREQAVEKANEIYNN